MALKEPVKNLYNLISGGNSEEDTPVPIPNTEVKLFSADDTWRVTARESRTPPDKRYGDTPLLWGKSLSDEECPRIEQLNFNCFLFANN